MAKSHAGGDEDVASSEVQAHDTIRHRHAADGKLEALQQQMQQIRQLENHVGEILELVERCKERREETRRASGDSDVKKRAAPSSEVRRSS